MTEAALPQAFDLVADSRCRLLVLGSFPGTRSLAERRYYAHPRNQFWQLLSPVAGVDLVPLEYADRLTALVAHGIGLWDVVGTAKRVGSLDSALRDVAPRDLLTVTAGLPKLRALGFNGGAAFKIGQRQMGLQPAIALVPLPSSSAAYTLPLSAKMAEWTKLQNWLG